jgi:hypothetical protein
LLQTAPVDGETELILPITFNPESNLRHCSAITYSLKSNFDFFTVFAFRLIP